MDSASSSTPSSALVDADVSNTNNIPIEIVSEEEMAFLEAALSSARHVISALPSVVFPQPRPASSLRRCAASPPPASDIEDSVGSAPRESFLRRFRSKRGLTVTDVTATEWCEKQMEFVLLHGKPKRTEAMKAGSDRHAQLEKEVIEKVEIRIKSVEESWAIKFMNFIVGTNQLLFEGLTRELPVIGVFEGIWMVGVIDEIQIPINEATLNPILVDTKTRRKATLPSEAQKRNARLQLMCYKYLWDSLIAEQFPADHFFSYFNLNPQYILSDVVRQYINSLGFDAKTFEDVITYYRNTCCLLPPSKEQLLLRYELQSDHSLLEEYYFSYDINWFKSQMKETLKIWLGEREAKFVSETEKWKCQFCKFTAICPMTATSRKGEQLREQADRLS
ncbi:exonuclease V, chloroplastic [Typha angustifolia]|uniref:exonuclease V, chloroplastic n=1 Tax=Typha angustifolia TaxID=59011 RepID=UPI003C2D46BD